MDLYFKMRCRKNNLSFATINNCAALKNTGKHLLIVLMVIMVSGLLSCEGYKNCIKGDGVYVTEMRVVNESFDGVEVEGSFNVYIKKDTIVSIEIDADENLLPNIFTRVRGGNLVIDNDNQCFTTKRTPRINISTPYIDELILNGSGILECDSMDADNAIVVLSGSGEIYVGDIYSGNVEIILDGSGIITVPVVTTETTEIRLEGSGEILIKDIVANTIDIDHESSGSIEVDKINAHKVWANLDGSGEIQLEGDADVCDLQIKGSGNIKAFRLYHSDCDAYISGSGTIYVFVYDYLSVDITGSGFVYFRGNPAITLIGDTSPHQVIPND